MGALIQDVRYTLRQLRKSPGFTVTAVLTLALGIGANGAIFTLIHGLTLAKLPGPHPEQLVRLGGEHLDCCVWGGRAHQGEFSIFSTDLYDTLRNNTTEFQELAAAQAGTNMGGFTVRRQGVTDAPLSEEGHFVSGNYFPMFEIAPALGRLLQPSDDVEGAPAVVVMSYSTWQRDYAADLSVVGSVFVINTHPVTVVGIAPKEFYGDRISAYTPDFYAPLTTETLLGTGDFTHHPENRWLYILGRIKPGVALAPLQSKISALLIPPLSAMPYYSDADGREELKKVHVSLMPSAQGLSDLPADVSNALHLLMGIAGLVLLIACANIANLVLARGMARRPEISVRTALGASRMRIVRQMLTESLLLSCLGGVFGLAVAYLGASVLLNMASPHARSSALHADPSPQILLFAFGISLVTGLAFGMAPAFVTSQANPADALRGSNRTAGGRSSLLQRSLVVMQAALSLVLLVGAGLLTKSLLKLQYQNFGMRVEGRVVAYVSPNNAHYTPEQLPALYDAMRAKMLEIPGVEKAALAMYTPLSGDSWSDSVQIQGRPKPGPKDDIGATWDRVSPEFFDAVGEPVLRGRGILATDTANSPGVAVVNQTFVRRFFSRGEDPIGRHFGTNADKSGGDREIVGIVEDTKYQDLGAPQRPMFFLPMLQLAQSDNDKERAAETRSIYMQQILLVTKGPTPNLEMQVRKALASINPDLNLEFFQTMHGQISDQLVNARLTARLTMVFGLLALVLASVGLYGVTAYSVARRTSEIGVRMALGAARGDVVAMVMRGAMLQAGIGLAIGVPAALVCVRFVQSQLYDIAGRDFGVMAVAVLTLITAACIAGWIPARRAASLDPAKTLRTE